MTFNALAGKLTLKRCPIDNDLESIKPSFRGRACSYDRVLALPDVRPSCYFHSMLNPSSRNLASLANVRFLGLRLGLCAPAMLAAFAFVAISQPASAQITTARTLSASPDPLATLEEQLVNRLRATAEDQRNYLKFVVKQVREGKLDVKLVVGIERYALRRNPSLPFLFFERALKFEAGKRGVSLPPVRQFATARVPDGISR